MLEAIFLPLFTINLFLISWHGLSPYCRIKRGQTSFDQEIPVIITGLLRGVFLYGLVVLLVTIIGVYQKVYLLLAVLMVGVVVILTGTVVLVCVRSALGVVRKGFSCL